MLAVNDVRLIFAGMVDAKLDDNAYDADVTDPP
jgi:hypothetical protein